MHYIILSTKTALKHGTAAGLHGHFGLMQSSDRVHGLFGKVLGSRMPLSLRGQQLTRRWPWWWLITLVAKTAR
jgi:hypothetical protein